MEFFKNTHIDFMKYRLMWAAASAALVVLAIVAIFVHGKLNIGIDFAGGTELIVRFQDAPDTDKLRAELTAAGIDDAQIQRFGDADSHEVVIRTPLDEDAEGDTSELLAILNANYNGEPAADGFDLNLGGSDALADYLLGLDPFELRANDEALAREEYERAAKLVLGQRKVTGLFSGWDEITGIDGLEPEIATALESKAQIGSFAALGGGFVGPAIGAELRMKGLLAVVFSILVMMLYIWVRFELRFGVGAMLAIVHDVFVTLGLFALMDFEFNLSIIAAFLTLVGYSVNDTVVVFDRVRENMRKTRRESFVDTLNTSINQTLSRTILTSGTTLLAVGALYFFGGEVLRGFSFVLLVGVIVGTYSSIFVASAFALLWEELTHRRQGGDSHASKSNGGSKKSGGKSGRRAVAS
ncbi:MAG: protein translocase subunit SecF [Thermoanaerobaculia bacterium]|nr:protein translocase subunit SecF [Thermoanaerobaculia bacterium]